MAPEKTNKPRRNFRLPLYVYSSVQLKKLLRSAKEADDFMMQANIRKPGSHMQLPKGSLMLDKLSDDNNLSLLKPEDRQFLISALTMLDNKAPVIHISFASNPNDKFLIEIVKWFRSSVHPYILLQVGLQPSMAGGFTLRTRNKYLDLSLRRHFANKQNMLVKLIDEVAQK
jgi:F0F1-type ATP synthase delta subunit